MAHNKLYIFDLAEVYSSKTLLYYRDLRLPVEPIVQHCVCLLLYMSVLFTLLCTEHIISSTSFINVN